MPNQLIAVTGRILLSSHDGGCTWDADSRLTFPEHHYRFLPAGSYGTLAWTIYGPQLFFIGAHSVQQRTAPVLEPRSVMVHAQRPNELAVADTAGAVWWSDDAGGTWQPRPSAPARAPLYALEFSPLGRAHAIATGLADGAHVTFDGGATWERSAGVDGLNLFTVAMSPLDGNVVWAIGLDPKQTEKKRRWIFHSADGGRSFTRVLNESDAVQMSNGFTLAPHPADASLLYFALPGTTLYLIDHSGAIRRTTHVPQRDINAILFSPVSPEVMYFGLKISDMSVE